FIAAEIEQKAQPTPEEVRAAWGSLNFFVQVREIAVATKQEADEIRTAILRGGDIDTLVRTCSLAHSSRNAGHVVSSWGQHDPLWEDVVFALEPGELSPVIETKNGYEVVTLENRVDAP